MHYTFFEFEHFKGIRRARIDLSSADSAARVYALVGLNESGKTTLLEAVDQFQASDEGVVSPKQLAGWISPDPNSFIPIADRTNFNGTIKIRCGIELEDSDIAAARDHLKQVDGYKLEELNRQIEITDEYRFEASRFKSRKSMWVGLRGSGRSRKGRVTRQLTLAADSVRWQKLTRFIRDRLPTIWFFPNFLFEFPERIYLAEHDGETDSNRFYRALFQDILDALGQDLDVPKHILERFRSDTPADRDNLDQVLLRASRHVTERVVASWNRIFLDRPITEKRVRMHVDQDAPRQLPDGSTEEGRIWVAFQLEDGDGIFAIRERSLGFRWFFVYLMLTTYRGLRTNSPNDMLFLFDEPASNLHPTAQRALLQSLETLSHRAGIVYTTHSHHLINPEWLGTTFVVANEGLDPEAISVDFTAKRTDVQVTPYRQFAAHHPEQAHFFQPILDVLDYAPSDLELVPDAVMVEGKSDFYVLSYFQKVILQLPASDRLHLMPGGGAGTLDELIQLYLGWGRPFVALLDSDRAGRSEARRYTDKFGRIIEPHLVELADASGKVGVKGIESVLSKSDRLKFQRVADPESETYRKRTFALGVQEALVSQQKIDLTKTAHRLLTRTVEGLNARLANVR